MKHSKKVLLPSPAPPPPLGIGGWLVLPGIGLVLAAVLSAVALATCINLFGSPKLAALVTRWPAFKTCLVGETAADGVLLFANLALLGLFVRRHPLTPRLMIAYYVFNILVVGGLSAWSEALVPAYRSDGVPLARAIIVAAIWIPYFVLSKRVRSTFCPHQEPAGQATAA